MKEKNLGCSSNRLTRGKHSVDVLKAMPLKHDATMIGTVSRGGYDEIKSQSTDWASTPHDQGVKTRINVQTRALSLKIKRDFSGQ